MRSPCRPEPACRCLQTGAGGSDRTSPPRARLAETSPKKIPNSLPGSCEWWGAMSRQAAMDRDRGFPENEALDDVYGSDRDNVIMGKQLWRNTAAAMSIRLLTPQDEHRQSESHPARRVHLWLESTLPPDQHARCRFRLAPALLPSRTAAREKPDRSADRAGLRPSF